MTHTHGVGSTVTMLADESGGLENWDLSSLRRIITGGEVISPVSVQKWLAAAPNLTVINAYGPTEATCTIITHLIFRREPHRTALYPSIAETGSASALMTSVGTTVGEYLASRW